MKFIIGARGRLGQALARQWSVEPACCVDRAIYTSWSGASGSADAARFLDAHASAGDTMLVASGLLDPALPAAEHVKVNVTLPANLIAAAVGRGIKVVTFGTVMETLQAHPNPYVSSKVALAARVTAAAATQPLLHVRIHTLYGQGEPSAFMFLGQILASLRNGTPFEMTSGRQLREYHHVDDDARAIAALCEADVRGLVELSSGAPLTLRALAEGVFDALGARAQLRVGARAEPAEENYGAVFEPHPLLADCHFRPTISSVVSYLQAYV